MYNIFNQAKSFVTTIFKRDSDYKGIDKLKHFSICYLVALFDTKISIGIALGKEMGDYFNSNSHWCWWDIVADTLGIILGTLTRVGILTLFI